MTLTLTGFIRDAITPVGITTLSMTFDDEPRTKTLMVPFLVVELPSAYKVIIGRPTFNKLQLVISMYHRNMKFPTNTRGGEARSDPRESRQCYLVITTIPKRGRKETPVPDPWEPSKLDTRPEPTEPILEVPHTARCQWPARKRLLARGEVAGAAPTHSQPAEGRLPTGKASRRLRRGSDSDVDGQRGQEG
ncbi:hypothetical protein GW17_00061921 [Ensete ventricosum]|nr:hypothetical protein GW17_00061921 [Ensete ventricosum]